MENVYAVISNFIDEKMPEEQIYLNGVFSDEEKAVEEFNKVKKMFYNDALKTMSENEIVIEDKKNYYMLWKRHNYGEFHSEVRIVMRTLNQTI